MGMSTSGTLWIYHEIRGFRRADIKNPLGVFLIGFRCEVIKCQIYKWLAVCRYAFRYGYIADY